MLEHFARHIFEQAKDTCVQNKCLLGLHLKNNRAKCCSGGNNGQPDVNKESLKHFMLIQSLLHPDHHLHLLV